MKNARLTFCVLFVILFACSFTLNVSASTNHTEENQVFDGVAVDYSPDTTTSRKYTQCDATDSLVFFTFGYDDIIDAYDYNGNFQFSLSFLNPEHEKGILISKCEEDRLVVITKNDVLYEINADKVLSYTSDFDKGIKDSFDEVHYWANKKNIYFRNSEGDWEILMKTPSLAQKHIYAISVAPEYHNLINALNILVILTFCACIGFMIYKLGHPGKRHKT